MGGIRNAFLRYVPSFGVKAGVEKAILIHYIPQCVSIGRDSHPRIWQNAFAKCFQVRCPLLQPFDYDRITLAYLLVLKFKMER